MHVIAAKAVAFKEALSPEFKTYQQQVLDNAKAMANVLMQRGYDIVSGGTDDHLMLIDLIRKGITGKETETALSNAFITTNKNAVPNDPQSPFITSGIRIGTPAVTTRGFKVKECEQVANWMADIMDDIANTQMQLRVREAVKSLCQQFPVYATR